MKIRRIWASALICLISLMLIFSLSSCNLFGKTADGSSNGLNYTLSNDGSYYILSSMGMCFDKDITIPESYNGLPVKEIGNTAFSANEKPRARSITSISLPSSIEKIGDRAFEDCSSLSSIKLASGGRLESIGASAFRGCTSLFDVKLPDGLTSIGESAFRGCTALKSISIPNSITSVGANAFTGCDNLSYNENRSAYYLGCDANPYVILMLADNDAVDIEINRNTKFIYDGAFDEASILSRVFVPNNIVGIGSYAFLAYPDFTVYVSATEKPDGWASDWADENVPVVWNVKGFYTSNNSVYALKNNSTALLIKFSTVTDSSSREVPDTVNGHTVTAIGDKAFYETKSMTSIKLPNTVTEIGRYAFYGCENLQHINLPESLTTIGGFAFGGCSSVEGFTLPESLTSIGESAFYGCWSISSMTIPAGTVNIGSAAFAECPYLTIYASPASKPDSWADDWNIFQSNENTYSPVIWNIKEMHTDDLSITYVLKEDGTAMVIDYTGAATALEIPENVREHRVTAIANGSFFNNKLLESVTIPDGVTAIGNNAFSLCIKLNTVALPDSLTDIGDSVFSGCELLVNIIIPDGVTRIGNAAFTNCLSLTSISIPSDLKIIGESTFSNCPNIESITIPDGVTSIGEWAFSGCTKITEIVVPDSVTSIGEYAFYKCSALNSIVIPESVQKISMSMFTDCTRLIIFAKAESKPAGWEIYSYDENKNIVYGFTEFYSDVSGIKYALTKSNKALVITCRSSSYYVSIPSDVEGHAVSGILNNAFRDFKNIRQFALPDGIESIGDFAFAGCTRMSTVSLPDSVNTVGNSAFRGCSGLTSVIVGSGVNSFGDGAFSNCGKLSDVFIKSMAQWCAISFKNPDANPLNSATSLYLDGTKVTKMEIPEGVTRISDYAFYNFSVLTGVTLPASLTSIGGSAFYGCTALTEIVIPSNVSSIGWGAFYGCTALAIKAEAASQPEGWNSGWNYSGCPVVWNYEEA